MLQYNPKFFGLLERQVLPQRRAEEIWNPKRIQMKRMNAWHRLDSVYPCTKSRCVLMCCLSYLPEANTRTKKEHTSSLQPMHLAVGEGEGWRVCCSFARAQMSRENSNVSRSQWRFSGTQSLSEDLDETPHQAQVHSGGPLSGLALN